VGKKEGKEGEKRENEKAPSNEKQESLKKKGLGRRYYSDC
jgi:hypothetical protein